VLDELSRAPGIALVPPEAGMFVLADVRGTGLDGKQFARGLLDEEGVSLLPGVGFGPNFAGFVRLSLAQPEDRLREACRRMARFAAARTAVSSVSIGGGA
jgi:arginine:pyruvate transaminase